MKHDRAFLVHYAKVMLHECSLRRRSRANRLFYWTLFDRAQNARRRAAATPATEPQGSLFA